MQSLQSLHNPKIPSRSEHETAGEYRTRRGGTEKPLRSSQSQLPPYRLHVSDHSRAVHHSNFHSKFNSRSIRSRSLSPLFPKCCYIKSTERPITKQHRHNSTTNPTKTRPLRHTHSTIITIQPIPQQSGSNRSTRPSENIEPEEGPYRAKTADHSRAVHHSITGSTCLSYSTPLEGGTPPIK